MYLQFDVMNRINAGLHVKTGSFINGAGQGHSIMSCWWPQGQWGAGQGHSNIFNPGLTFKIMICLINLRKKTKAFKFQNKKIERGVPRLKIFKKKKKEAYVIGMFCH